MLFAPTVAIVRKPTFIDVQIALRYFAAFVVMEAGTTKTALFATLIILIQSEKFEKTNPILIQGGYFLIASCFPIP